MPDINDLNKLSIQGYSRINDNLNGSPIDFRLIGLNGPQSDAGANPTLNFDDATLADIKQKIIDAAKAGDIDTVNKYEDLLVHTPLQQINNGQVNAQGPEEKQALVNNIRFIETAKHYAAQNSKDEFIKGDKNQILTLDQINEYYGDGKYTATDGSQKNGLGNNVKSIIAGRQGGAQQAKQDPDFDDILNAYNAAETQKRKLSETDPGSAQYTYNEKTGQYDSVIGKGSISAEKYAQLESDWTKETGKIALAGGQTANLNDVHYDPGTKTVWATTSDGTASVISNGSNADVDYKALQTVAQQAQINLGDQGAAPEGTKKLAGLSSDESGSYSWNASKDTATGLAKAAAASNATDVNDPPIYIAGDAQFTELAQRAGVTPDGTGSIKSSEFSSLYSVMTPEEKQNWDAQLGQAGIGGADAATRIGGAGKWATFGKALASQYSLGAAGTPGAAGTGTTSANNIFGAAPKTADPKANGTPGADDAAGVNTTITKNPSDYLKTVLSQPGVGAASAQTVEDQQRAQNETAISKIAQAYGLNLSGDEIKSQVDGIINGGKSLEAIQKQYMEQTISRYPGIADQLKAGSSLQDIAGTYIKDMADTLELDPNNITLNDPTIQKALSSINDKGTITAMPRWDFVNNLKADPRYQYTNSAYNDYASLAGKIAQTFGSV